MKMEYRKCGVGEFFRSMGSYRSPQGIRTVHSRMQRDNLRSTSMRHTNHYIRRDSVLTSGVFSKCVTFHSVFSGTPWTLSTLKRVCTNPSSANAIELHAFSDLTGMFERLTVSARETSIMLYVALKSGSSQQGKARRAIVGCA